MRQPLDWEMGGESVILWVGRRWCKGLASGGKMGNDCSWDGVQVGIRGGSGWTMVTQNLVLGIWW